MKKLLNPCLYILLIVAAHAGLAQDENPHLGVTNVLKLNFFLPGISYEQKVGRYQTLNISGYLDGLIINNYENGRRQSHLVALPTFSMEFRNYYNLNKRDAKGKSTALNSGNYIAPLFLSRYSRSTLPDPALVNQVGAVWGMQRNYPKGFSLDLNGGLAYTINGNHLFNYDPIELIVQAKIGFWLGHKSH